MRVSKTPPCWTVLDENDNPIQIEYAERKTRYFCPDCRGIMIPKMGEVMAHHFAHKPNPDGTMIQCGGEGYRHFRVKTFAHSMLNSIAKHEFLYDLEILMEKAHGEDIPDISIKKSIETGEEPNSILAIEIIDTHPPSDEKRKRWRGRMLEIVISDWGEEMIGNAARLSGALIPWLTSFHSLTKKIRSEEDKSDLVVQRLRDRRIEKIEKIEQEIEDELQLMLKNSKNSIENEIVSRRAPRVWFGNWARIPKKEQIHQPQKRVYDEKAQQIEWGVSIKAYEDDGPKAGDWVWIKKKKDGSFQHAIIGSRYDMTDWITNDLEMVFIYKHHLITRATNPPELSELLKNYSLIQ